MKAIAYTLFSLMLAANLSGQGVADALRYSTMQPMGTARYMGTNGSLTPMGTDPTTLHTNPAGIGFNRYNAAYITGGTIVTGAKGILTSEENNAGSSNTVVDLALPSAGILWTGTTRSVNWSTLNFSLNLTRLADFGEEATFNGSTLGSISNQIVTDLNLVEDGFLTEDDIFYRALLYGDLTGGDYFDADNPDPSLRGYFSPFDYVENEGIPLQKSGVRDRDGSMHEFAFGLGGAYRDKFAWGLAVGVPFYSFEEIYTYEEVDANGELIEFDDATYTTNLESSGNGVNFKLGVIYRPTQALRFSLGAHSPTFWSMDETYFTSLDYNYEINGQALGGLINSGTGQFAYNLQTPWRFNGGVGLLVRENGFVSVDFDYVNYAANSLSFDDFAVQAEAQNEDIDAQLGSALGIRAGGELNLKPFQVRAGLGYQQLPYATDSANSGDGIVSVSGGLGYSKGKFFADIAARYETFTDEFAAYDVVEFPRESVEVDFSRTRVFLTVGFRGFGSGF